MIERVRILSLVEPIADDGVDPRDVDLDRALIDTARTTGTEVVERLRGVLAVDTGLPAGRDAACVGLAAERVPADGLKVRTGVETGRATNAVQRFPKLLVRTHLHPTVVDQHEMELPLLAVDRRRIDRR